MNIPVGSIVQPTLTIALGAQLSGAIPTGGMSLVGVMLPAAFTGVALTFFACNSIAGTYEQIFNAAGAVSYPCAAGQYIAIDPKDFYGVMFLKIKSGTIEVAARSIVCSMKGI